MSSRSTSGCARSCASNSCGSSSPSTPALPNAWSSRSAVAGLLEILAITSRGDARGDVLKELERQMSALRDFQNRPGVDGARLRAVLAALMRRREELNAAGANFMQKLRESEFLNAIKHRSAIPGGTCEFDLPDFFHWLSLDADTREADLAAWIATIRPLCESISELLWITRENARPTEETAPGGSFQIVFERDRPVQLLRITLPGGVAAVPRGERQPSPLLAALPALEQRPQPARCRRARTSRSCSRPATERDGARSRLPALRHAPRMGAATPGGRSAASAAR